MMGFVDRINAALLRRIVPVNNALSLKPVDLDGVRRLVAFKHVGFVEDTIVLVAEMKDGRILRAEEGVGEWDQLLAALDMSGLTTSSSRLWMLELIGREAGEPVELVLAV